MLIAVGSKNPVKISAVENVFRRIYPRIEVAAVEVDSLVSDMPTTDGEALKGARTRARRARESVGADLGVGLEGSSTVIMGRHLTGGWAAVYDGVTFGLGGGGHLLLPQEVSRKITVEGKELGTAIDEITGGVNTKQKSGAIGVLTRGLSSRQEAYEYILIYALAPFITPELYGKR